MAVVLFEDALVSRLAPISWTRPAYAISCAGTSLCELIAPWRQPLHAVARDYLQGVEMRQRPHVAWGIPVESRSALLVNARLAPSQPALHWLQQLVRRESPAAAFRDRQLLAAWLPQGLTPSRYRDLTQGSGDGPAGAATITSTPPITPVESNELQLLEYPHDVIRCHEQHFQANLEAQLRDPAYREVAEGVFAREPCVVRSSAAFDTRRGPVLLDAGAIIEHHTVLRGPVRVGAQARVNEGASVKDAVCLGAHARVGGEVMTSIIGTYSNKQHSGFLGHSYVGSWVNLGAGTSVSNLKNTYGSVRAQYGHVKVDTGMQFLGVTIADHVKTAINTGIFTGKTIGVASQLYGFVTSNVPCFVNYAPLFGSITAIPPDVVATAQQRVLLRRNVFQSQEDVALLHELFLRTESERLGLAAGPPTF